MKKGTIIIYGKDGASESLECLCMGCGYQVERLDKEDILKAKLQEESTSLLLFDFETKEVSETAGLALLSELRQFSEKPMIALVDREHEMLRILALNAGADDVLDHGDSSMECFARIQAKIRCYARWVQQENRNVSLRLKDLELDDNAKTVLVKGKPVSLTPIEYKILHLLVTRQGKVMSNKEIYSNIWKMEPIGADNTIAVHIRHIREKIEDNPKEPRYLQVVWGQGYKVG